MPMLFANTTRQVSVLGPGPAWAMVLSGVLILVVAAGSQFLLGYITGG